MNFYEKKYARSIERAQNLCEGIVVSIWNAHGNFHAAGLFRVNDLAYAQISGNAQQHACLVFIHAQFFRQETVHCHSGTDAGFVHGFGRIDSRCNLLVYEKRCGKTAVLHVLYFCFGVKTIEARK